MFNLYIGFSRPKSNLSILSKIIRKVENTEFSHVYLRFHIEYLDNINIIYEARGTTVHFIEFENFKEKSIVIEEFKINIEESVEKNILMECIKNLEVEYGFLQLVGIGLVKLLECINIRIKNPFRNKRKGFICSEAVGYILRDKLGIKIDKNLDSITPSDINKIIRQEIGE